MWGAEASPYGLGLGQEEGTMWQALLGLAPSLSSMVTGAQLSFLTVLKPLGKEASAMNPQWRSTALREEWEETDDKGRLLESEWLTMRLLGSSHRKASIGLRVYYAPGTGNEDNGSSRMGKLRFGKVNSLWSHSQSELRASGNLLAL